MLPASHGNPAPIYRTCITLPAGPRRVVDDGERARFHVAGGARSGGRRLPADCTQLRRYRKILVVALDFLGDWVLKSPFLRILRHNAPKATITVVVLDRVYDLASACPFVDRVISLTRGDRRRVVFAAANVTALAGFRRDFRDGAFDLAVVPRWDADFNGALQIAYASRALRIVGFSERSTPRKRRLNRGDDRFYTHAISDDQLVHEADRDMALIGILGGQLLPAIPSVAFSHGDKDKAERFLTAALGSAATRFLAVAPLGSSPRRTLPAEIFAPLVCQLAQRFHLAVVVVGGPRDDRAAAAFVKALAGAAVSSAGVLGARQNAALIARATAFIGMDSGPAHIAAAVGTPVAVLSCHPEGGDPTHASAPERFAPRGMPGYVLVIRPETAMAPCKDACDADEAHCIRQLTADVLLPRLADFVSEALRR